MKKCWSVYLALLLLIISVAVIKVKEGLENDISRNSWLDYSTWFTPSVPPSKTETKSSQSVFYNSNYGVGSSGTKYEKEEDENTELTSNEKTHAKSALTKIIARNENNETLISCVNKVKVYI
jgi:hypothetical protein